MQQQQNKTIYPWRTESEINLERQNYLAQCLTTKPDIQQGIYPFKDIKLCRADIEWLLVKHEDGRGPVDWSDERQRERLGLDLRGADLRQVDLRKLPLTRMRSGLTRDEWNLTTLEQRHMAGAYLQGADLSEAHLEGAILQGAHLEGVYLPEAHLQGADLRNAFFDSASNLERIILRNEKSGCALLADVHWGSV